MLEVCLLGCAGMLPLPDRWLTAMLLRNSDRMILVDCGEGTQIPIRLAGWGFKAIDAIFFTHYHADHIAGLPGLLLTMGNCGRKEPLSLYGPPGLERIVSSLCVIAPELPFELKLIELPSDRQSEISVAGLKMGSLPCEHRIPCLTYRFELSRSGRFDPQRALKNHIPVEFWKRLQNGERVESGGISFTNDMVLGPPRKGLKISYCTDSRPTPALVSFVGGSDLFICEGLYGDEKMTGKAALKSHMVFKEAAQTARDAFVKELWLTHFSPALDNPNDWIDTTRQIFKNTYLGGNLMKKELRFDDDDSEL